MWGAGLRSQIKLSLFMLPLVLQGEDAKADFQRVWELRFTSQAVQKSQFWGPKQWIFVSYQLQARTTASTLLLTADVWDFWLSHRGQAGEAKWIAPPRAAPTVKNAAVMMSRCFPGNSADGLLRIRRALEPARMVGVNVPPSGTTICFPTRPQTCLRVTCGLFGQGDWCAGWQAPGWDHLEWAWLRSRNIYWARAFQGKFVQSEYFRIRNDFTVYINHYHR